MLDLNTKQLSTKIASQGFTLIELMVVVVIIAILAAIALPNFFGMQDRAKEAEIKNNAHTVQTAIEDYKALWNARKPQGFKIGSSDASLAGVPAVIKNPFSRVTGINSISVFTNTANPDVPPGNSLAGVADGQIAYYDGQIGPYGVYGVGKTRIIASPVIIRLDEGN